MWTDDGRTDDGRQMITIAHPDSCSGELKSVTHGQTNQKQCAPPTSLKLGA